MQYPCMAHAPAFLTVEPANAMDTVAAQTRGTGERAVAPLGMCCAGL